MAKSSFKGNDSSNDSAARLDKDHDTVSALSNLDLPFKRWASDEQKIKAEYEYGLKYQQMTTISTSFLHFLISPFPISHFCVPSLITTRDYTLSFRWTGNATLSRSRNICNHRYARKCTRKCLTALLLWRHMVFYEGL